MVKIESLGLFSAFVNATDFGRLTTLLFYCSFFLSLIVGLTINLAIDRKELIYKEIAISFSR